MPYYYGLSVLTDHMAVGHPTWTQVIPSGVRTRGRLPRSCRCHGCLLLTITDDTDTKQNNHCQRSVPSSSLYRAVSLR